jgi:hypothetical protein
MPEPLQIESFSVKIGDSGVHVSAQKREEHHPPAGKKADGAIYRSVSTMTG